MRPLTATLASALVALAATGAALEAAEAPVRLTLAEAVSRAREASALLAQNRALEEAAAADRRAAGAQRLPLVEASAGYTRGSHVPELVLSLPGQAPRTLFPDIPDNGRARLGLSLPLYTGGRLGALAEAADREREAASHDTRTAEADLVLETTAAYWSLVTARESERVLAEALEAFDAHLRDARNREAQGLAARNEVLAVSVERERADLARLRSRSGAEGARANLVRLLDLPASAAVEPTEPLPSATAAAEDVETLVGVALASRPERSALAARVSAADARRRLEGAARLPQVGAAAGWDYANPNRKITPPTADWKDTWDASVNLTWSVFDSGRTSAAVARARARADALRQALADLDRRIRLQVTLRRLDLETARAAVDVAERSREAAEENRRVVAERYREGVAASSELLDAEVVLLRAGLERTDALAQTRLARAALDRAVGRE